MSHNQNVIASPLSNRMTRVPRSAWRPVLFFAASFLACLALWAQVSVPTPGATQFNKVGSVLISDQYNNRVIEVQPATGKIVWQFGLGPQDFSPRSAIGANDAERIGTLTLIACTGIPPSTVPNCTSPDGCPDNRVILVNPQGRILWQYGTFGVTGSDPDQLNTPVQSTYLPNGHILITDQGNQRVIEVDHVKNIVWQYGTTGVSGSGPNQLTDPNSAELLDSGNILIADENNNRVIEVMRDGTIAATFTAGGTLGAVAFASRLPNGDTLITDAGNNRAVEVDPGDHVVWQYATNTDFDSNPNPQPSRAIRLINGNTIISDQFNHRVIVVDPGGTIVSDFGKLDIPGYGPYNTSRGLFGPYDAKVIGDFTGLTNPYADADGDNDATSSTDAN